MDIQVTYITRPKKNGLPAKDIGIKVFGDNGALLADYTGNNALSFPDILAELTDRQVQELLQRVIAMVVSNRLGVNA